MNDWKEDILDDPAAKQAITKLRNQLREDLARGAIDVGPILDPGHTLKAIGPFLVLLPGTQVAAGGHDEASLELCEPDINRVNAIIEEVLAADAYSYGDAVKNISFGVGKIAYEISPIGDVTTIAVDGSKIFLYSGQTITASAKYTDGVRKINVTWDSLIAESAITGGDLLDRRLREATVGGARGSN